MRKTLLTGLIILFPLLGCSPAGNDPAKVEATDASSTQPEVAADSVYLNGHIYTVDDSQPWAEALAIRDGEFLFVGDTADAEGLVGPGTKVTDLEGKFVLPGLHDTHLHFESFYTNVMLEGKMLKFPAGIESIEALQQMLKEYADANPDLPLLFAENLPSDIFPNVTPTKAFIDEVIPDRPVIILTSSEHETVHNTAALEMAGITAETEVPEGGEIVLDPETGELTGLLKESAAGKWGWLHYPQLTREQHHDGMKALLDYLNSIGLTSGKQQHAKRPVATAFQDLENEGELTMRVGLSWTYKGPLEPMPLEEQEQLIANRQEFASDLIEVDFVKLSMDGTAGTTGLVVEPYEVTGDSGIAFYDLEDLGRDIAKFDAMGIGVTAHSSGDGAVRLFLDGLEAARDQNGSLKARHQVAHAALIHPDDIPRIRELGATVEFSPAMWFQTPLTEGLTTFIGEERMAKVLPAQSVLKSGGRIVFASDGPLFWQEPLAAMEATITRSNPAGGGGALAPGEAVSLEEAIRAYTIDSAWLMNQESTVGSIEVGKKADLIVLDRNLFELDSADISDARVLLTVFNGEVVYDAKVDATGEEAIEAEHGVELDTTSETEEGNLEVY